jgi:tetratricopeptide (TPR) repeat protein
MLEIAEKLNDKKSLVFGYNNIGSVYQGKGELDKWFDYSKKALAVANEIEYKDGQGYALSNIAGYHMMKEEYDIALQKFDQVLEIYKKLGDKQRQVNLYFRIGATYLSNKDSKKAFEMYSKALDLSIEMDNKNLMAVSYWQISDYYRVNEEYSMAFKNLFSARKIIKELNVPDKLANNFYWTGKNHSDRGDLDSAIVYLNRTIEIHQELGNMSLVGPLYFELSIQYLLKGDTGTSLDLMMKSTELNKKAKDNKRILWNQFITGGIYYTKQEYKTAVDEYMDPAIAALKEVGEDLDLFDTSIYFLCLKELKRDYDIADLEKLIEKEKESIKYINNYYLYKLLGERSYLQNAYDQVMKKKSNLEAEVAEKYINYPIVKEIIKEWEMNI